jgi:hypothetical protein
VFQDESIKVHRIKTQMRCTDKMPEEILLQIFIDPWHIISTIG